MIHIFKVSWAVVRVLANKSRCFFIVFKMFAVVFKMLSYNAGKKRNIADWAEHIC